MNFSKSFLESNSLILRSSHILKVRIDRAIINNWDSHSNQNLKVRQVKLCLCFLGILKGELELKHGDKTEKVFKQFETVNGKKYPVPGAWSRQNLEEKKEFILFCNSNSNKSSHIFTDELCQRVFEYEIVKHDLLAVLEAEKFGWTIREFLENNFQESHNHNFLLVEYLLARVDEILFSEIEGFNLLMDYFESPKVPIKNRSVLLSSLVSKFISADPVPSKFGSRFVIGVFRLLELPEAVALRKNILKVYLPNLLGLRGGGGRKDPKDIFLEFPLDKRKAFKNLKNCPRRTSDFANQLSRWIIQ